MTLKYFRTRYRRKPSAIAPHPSAIRMMMWIVGTAIGGGLIGSFAGVEGLCEIASVLVLLIPIGAALLGSTYGAISFPTNRRGLGVVLGAGGGAILGTV